ncbi:MAG TPA: sigma-54 dependent transcriptional regulator [Terriglobia bacterium]|jgi:DNA-binding NtrC family response regulator|nr:sigma-54 dependent transcriptional regulator [Terriglobia bacterium]
MDRVYRIGVVDDESESLASICRALKKVGYEVSAFEDGEVAVQSIDSFKDMDLVVTDLKMPRVDGIDLLKKVREVNQEAGFLIVTGHGTVETAVAALKTGADDYILKPLDLFELRDRVRHILERRKPGNEMRHLRRQMALGRGIEQIVGKSPAMDTLLEQIAIVAPTRTTVLLLGESGTGKDLVAQTLHQNSPRRRENFLPLNCSALSPSLLESELFGYEKGSFTGALERRLGKLELADHGTLFLDEIGEMPLDMQVKLLRFLETREIMRVGGASRVQLDVRLIAATNRDLEQAVEQDKFRKDLYYRLKVVTLLIPPLRERRADIPLLAWYFLETFAREHDKRTPEISPEAMDVLVRYSWPGNVRELKNLIENLVVFARQPNLALSDLPAELREAAETSDATESRTQGLFEDLNMDVIERQAIVRALEKTGGNRGKAAELLGIGLRTLQKKLKDYGMTER